VLARSHPDVRSVVPAGLSIGVDEMRAIVALAARRPALGRWQVVVIEDADRLTEQAANALLKAVEEPPPRTVFLLCAPSTHPDDVPLTIRVPARLSPDLYFIGFLVTPIPTSSGSLEVINQIGSFVTVDVPGPRVRRLKASLHVPSLALSGRARGTVRIANIGRAAVRFWGEEDTKALPGGSGQQQRFDPSLLPAGRYRYLDVSAKPPWPIGMVTMTVHLIYPGRTEATTKELTVSKRVLVINPIVVIALASLLLLLFGVFVVWWRRRRRGPLPCPHRLRRRSLFTRPTARARSRRIATVTSVTSGRSSKPVSIPAVPMPTHQR
jgi:DNA polymerase III delta prime subunit